MIAFSAGDFAVVSGFSGSCRALTIVHTGVSEVVAIQVSHCICVVLPDQARALAGVLLPTALTREAACVLLCAGLSLLLLPDSLWDSV